jgi:hypothetical protein
MLEEWEIKALKNDLLDYEAWAAHAVAEGIFPDTETALHYKAGRCATRMICACESIHGKLDPTKTIAEKVMLAFSEPDYKDRKQRDEEQPELN